MFILLSKIVNFFISPTTLLFCFCLLPLFILGRRSNKKFILLLPTLAFLLLISPIGPLLALPLESLYKAEFKQLMSSREDHNSKEKIGVVVLAGGVIKFNSTLNSFQFCPRFDRLFSPLLKFKNFENYFYVFSEGYSEAEESELLLSEGRSMALVADAFSLPKNRYAITSAAYNSFEEALAVEKVLKKNNISKFYLSTSAIHLPRAMAIYQKLGLSPLPFPTDFNVNIAKGDIYKFRLENLEILRFALHEYVGFLAYKITGKI